VTVNDYLAQRDAENIGQVPMHPFFETSAPDSSCSRLSPHRQRRRCVEGMSCPSRDGLFATQGKIAGVHIVAVNDYLAQLDAEYIGQLSVQPILVVIFPSY